MVQEVTEYEFRDEDEEESDLPYESDSSESYKSHVSNPPHKHSKRKINFDGVPSTHYRIYKVQQSKKGWIKKYQCLFGECRMEFSKSCHLRNHFRKHTGFKPFSCPICEQPFSQLGNKNKHMLTIHKVQPYLSNKKELSKQGRPDPSSKQR